MLGNHGRKITDFIFKPIVNILFVKKINPNYVTFFGSILAWLIAIIFFPLGLAWQGCILLGIVLFSDSIDGQLARKMGVNSSYGAVLDSVLDRITDGIVFSSIAIYCVYYMSGWIRVLCLVSTLIVMIMGFTISYVRARGADFKVEPKVGLAERTDRLIVSLVSLGFTDINLGDWIFPTFQTLLAVACIFTVCQRMQYIRKELQKFE